MTAAFRVNAQWIDFAHGPAAEEGQPRAVELVALPAVKDGAVSIPPDRRDLVAEVVSVAALYTSDSSVQADDRLWFRGYPGALVKRGRKWLATPDPMQSRFDKLVAERAQLYAFAQRVAALDPDNNDVRLSVLVGAARALIKKPE